MGQALMSGVRAIKEKKKPDEESQGLLSGQLSNVSKTYPQYSITANHL